MAIGLRKPSVSDGLPHDEAADKVDLLSRYVNDDDLVQIRNPSVSDGLPYDEAADKVDPLSRYVNDDDIVQLREENLIRLRRGDMNDVEFVQLDKPSVSDGLPHDEAADKIDPVSRYINDDDIVQIKEENLLMLNKPSVSDGLPHDDASDKIDPVSRYINDDDI